MIDACAASCRATISRPLGVAIEAMDDARSLDAGDTSPGRPVAVGQQTR
jgi:hypothetical protein